MDAELSLLMANQALAASGTLVMDPFVGTGTVERRHMLHDVAAILLCDWKFGCLTFSIGSLLCSSAEYGAMVMGGDIDPRVLRGAGLLVAIQCAKLIRTQTQSTVCWQTCNNITSHLVSWT